MTLCMVCDENPVMWTVEADELDESVLGLDIEVGEDLMLCHVCKVLYDVLHLPPRNREARIVALEEKVLKTYRGTA